jgi:RNA 2',3'-cyclic 3'-phosphodiesterase
VRLFVAVDVPPWSPPSEPEAPPHLTVRFLGEVLPSAVGGIEEAIASVSTGHVPFRVRLSGVGAFPDESRPRVVWIGVTEGAEELRQLAADLGAALDTLGWRGDGRPFVPHVTAFRVRRPGEAVAARTWLAANAGREFGEGLVGAVHLKESTLTPRGARHRTVCSFPLSGDAATS